MDWTEEVDDEINDETMPEEEASNRTFIIAASVLGGIVLLSIICLAAYALIFAPKQKADQAQEQDAAVAQNTQIAEMLTQTAESQILALTPLATDFVNTPTASPTPVVSLPTETPTATPNIVATETVAAALTQAAIAIQTTIPTSEALPDGGFADDVGIPGLLGMMIVLVAVIFFARRLRTSSVS